MVEVLVTSYYVHTGDTTLVVEEEEEEDDVESQEEHHTPHANPQNGPLLDGESRPFATDKRRRPRRYSERIKVKMRNMERYQYRLPCYSGHAGSSSPPTIQFGPLERLWVLVFVDMLAVGLVVPLLPYYAQNLGADAATYGYLGSLYGISQLIGSPLSTCSSSSRVAGSLLAQCAGNALTFYRAAAFIDHGLTVHAYLLVVRDMCTRTVGTMSDRFGRVNMLIVSSVASVVSYAMIGMAGSLLMLFLSRIPVGLLKQTMSVSYAYVSDVTDATSRAKYLG
jgi:hypothetical protein